MATQHRYLIIRCDSPTLAGYAYSVYDSWLSTWLTVEPVGLARAKEIAGRTAL